MAYVQANCSSGAQADGSGHWPAHQSQPAYREDRSFAAYVLLSAVTLSLYHFWFLHTWVKDLNRMCKGDGGHTLDVPAMLALGVLTLGVYPCLWIAGIVDRIYNNAQTIDIDVRQDGEAFFLWVMLLPVFGYFIAMHLAIRDTNRLAAAQNAAERESMHRASAAKAAARPDEHVTAADVPHSRPEKSAPCGKMIGLTGAYAGMSIPLKQGEDVLIGRDPKQVTLVVNGEKISRVHCVVRYNGDGLGYSITDCSSNGVLLNGKRMEHHATAFTESGAVLALANGANKFQLK